MRYCLTPRRGVGSSRGEVAVGAALILGFLTGIAAFFGGLMNANYLLAGTVSTNPILFILATWLVLRGASRDVGASTGGCCPRSGVPGHPGRLFRHAPAPRLHRSGI
jgi:thiosulfate dehydrogenase [quinone] large subunit